MKMLHMICDKTLKGGISSETIREMISVKKRQKLLREQRLPWFGHIEKMDDKRVPVKAKSFVVNSSKRDKLKK